MYSFVIALIGMVVYAAFQHFVGSPFSGVDAALLFAVLFIALSFYGRAARRLDDRSSQFTRNEAFRRRCDTDASMTAEERADRLAEFDGVLFLRPFAIDSTFRVTSARKHGLAAWLVPFYGLLTSVDMSLDEALRLHATGYGDFVAIGDEQLGIGATRHESTDTRWREDFRVLVQVARRIIVLPSDKDGIAWEIGQIIATPHWLEKTVFLLTPSGHDSATGFAPLAEVIERLRAGGLAVPADASHGDGLVFGPDLALVVRATVLVGVLTPNVAGAALRRCLRAAGGTRRRR